MNTTKSVYNKLFKEETRLASHEVELGLIDEISKELDAAYKQQDVESELISIMSKMDKAIGMCNIVIQKGEKTLAQIKELGVAPNQIPDLAKLERAYNFNRTVFDRVKPINISQ